MRVSNHRALQLLAAHAKECDTPSPAPLPLHQGESRRVAVGRFDRRLDVRGAPPEVQDLLVTTRHEAAPDSDHGYRVERQYVSLLDVTKPYGPLDKLAALVTRNAGYPVVLERPCIRRLAAPNLQAIPSRRRDSEMLDLIHRRPEGLVRYRRGRVEVARLICQACIAYPTAQIAVVEESAERRQRLLDQLREMGLKSVAAVDAARCPEEAPRVVVASWFGLGCDQVDSEKRHILIVADARQALGQRSELALCMVDAAFRLFGLLADDCRLSPGERDRLHATFGFDEVYVPAHGHVVRPVRVAWYSHDDAPASSRDAGDIATKRKFIWHNPIRNRRIARLARAIADDEAAWLNTYASNVARGVADVAGRRTVVLVENVDHAVAIAQRLPGWPIVTGPEVDCSGLTTRQRELLSARRTPRWQYPAAIVTAQGFKQLSLDEIDVVVRASAGCGAAPIPEDSLVVRPPRDRPLLVVDVRDRRHPVLARWARRRRDQYGMKGWLEPGREPIVARMIQFLKTRPRRQS